MKRWRSTPTKYFATRPIFKEEFPSLIEAMKDDGLMAMITHEGILWYHHDFRLTKKVVRDVWGLTENQLQRIENYIYGHDPFVEVDE